MDEFLRPVNYEEIYYDKHGSICLDTSIAVFAKQITKTSDQINALSHYILFKLNVMVDPWGEDSTLRNLRECRFKKVKKESFDSYVKYLKTKEKRFLTISERNTYG